MNSELVKIPEWLESNRLSLNVSITHYMLFSSKGMHAPVTPEDVLVKDIKIDCVRKTKFLGVMVDDILSWGDHIQYINGKWRMRGVMNNNTWFRQCLDFMQARKQVHYTTKQNKIYIHTQNQYNILQYFEYPVTPTRILELINYCITALTNTNRVRSYKNHIRHRNIKWMTLLWLAVKLSFCR